MNPTVPSIEPIGGYRLLPAGLRTVPPTVRDTLLAAILTATLVVDLAQREVPPGGPLREADPLGYVLVAMLVAPLALRCRFPLAVFSLILVDAVAVAILLYAPTSFGFGLIVATYTVARWCDRDTSIVALLLAQAFAVFIKLRVMAAGIDIGWFEWPLDATYIGGGWFLGRSIRSRQAYARALEQSREQLAERAVADERTRIARELHDAVGHSISVMNLHLGAAHELIDRSPDRAKEALASAGDVGRGAMTEMDQLLGILRSTEAERCGLLQPSIANLDTLVEEFRELGLDVDLRTDGTARPVPAPVDRAAFRIVQEALTNTLKHAGRTSACIRLRYRPAEVEVDIRDAGRRAGHPTIVPAGHQPQGIIGMRERATLLKGDLEVGRNAGGGFRVVARLPTSMDGS